MLRRITLASILLALLWAPSQLGASPDATTRAVSADGTAYIVRSGSEEPELRLEVRYPDHGMETYRVPGTEGDEIEESPHLTVDDDVVHIVWRSRLASHFALHLVSWSPDSGWSLPVEFSGSPFSIKSNPRITVTRDEFLERTAETTREGHRTLIHLVWWDESSLGGRPLYVTLPIVDGELQEFTAPVDLRELAPRPDSTAVSEGTEAPEALIERPQVVRAERGIRLGFVGADKTEYVVLNVRLPSPSLQSIADKARAQVIVWGQDHPDAGLEDLANRAAETIRELGKRLMAPDVTDYVASQTVRRLRGLDPGTSLESIADEARAQVIIWGSRVGGGVRNLHEKARAQVIVWGSEASDESPQSTLIEQRYAYPIPQLPDAATGEIVPLMGSDGVILAWYEGPETLAYIEFRDGTTEEIHRLALDQSFDLRSALETLRSRIEP